MTCSKKRQKNAGAAGVAVVILILVCAVLVVTMIRLNAESDQRELDAADAYVTELVKQQYDAVPECDCQVLFKKGEHTLVTVVFSFDTALGGRAGAYLLDVSNMSQQVYHVAGELPADYDFKPDLGRYRLEWCVG